MMTILFWLFLMLQGQPTAFQEKLTWWLSVGNTKEMALQFSPNVELTLLQEKNIYSKLQAEKVLDAFFTKHKPTAFKLLHKGNSGKDITYYMGTLSTAKETLRVSVFTKEVKGKILIHELRIDPEKP